MKKNNNKINIKNKRALFDYEVHSKFVAGIQLMGSEIKSIRLGKARITESFCQVKQNEVFVINMFVEEYTFAKNFAHLPRRERKLLLNKKEIKKIHQKVKEAGFALIPLKLFITERGFAKLEIALAKGKKNYDKRESIKERDLKVDLGRDNKYKLKF